MHAKIQHYVPQLLLKQFGTGKKNQLHVLDKHTGRTFVSNARNVASERAFYDFVVGEHSFSIEASLSELESKTKKVLKHILERDSLADLTADARATLCAFLAVQFTRTRHFRLQWSSLPGLLAEHLRKHGDVLAPALEEYIRTPDENQAAMETAKIISEAPGQFGPHFASKAWVLFRTAGNHPFIIGDNPLALQNTMDRGPLGNLGLAVPGIEIYLPLTPTRALGCLCPSIIEAMRSAAHRLRGMHHLLPADFVPKKEKMETMIEAVEKGAAVEMSNENIVNLNSLQVRFAERYLFSSLGDFVLAREMLAAHPELRNGPRFEVG